MEVAEKLENWVTMELDEFGVPNITVAPVANPVPVIVTVCGADDTVGLGGETAVTVGELDPTAT
jgi:hypothetical protein